MHNRSGQFVVPGDKIGVIEEFTPGPGTYVKEGDVRSKIVGRVIVDLLNKRAFIYPSVRAASFPKVGSVIVGQVQSVQSKLALIRIMKVGKRQLSGFFTGVLHASDIGQGLIKNMRDVCLAGDIIQAKVISEKNMMYHLSIAERNLGVIYAFCSQCGYNLSLRERELRCSRCGNVERRKIALNYGVE